LGGEILELGQGIGIHAQVGVADSRLSAMKVLAEFWEQAHIKSYHRKRKNGRASDLHNA
jgi:hypothetical protein